MRRGPGLIPDPRRGRLRTALLAIVCCIPVACNKPAAELFPVRGEVFLEGKPAAGASVVFHPVDEDAGTAAYATVQEDGSFELSTYGERDGAEPGKYLVTLSWRDEKKVDDEIVNGPDRFNDRFSNPKTTTIKVTVVEGENVVPRYDFKEKDIKKIEYNSD